METTYLVGRSAQADIRVPKQHDAVGKRHLELTDLGAGQVRIKDLQSSNGTFLGLAGRWEELKEERTVDADVEIMLGDYRTTPRALLAMIAKDGVPALKIDPATAKPAKRPPRLRRNESGEIVKE